MVSTAREADSQVMIIRPRLGTGRQTTVDDLNREVRQQFKLVGLPLPVKKRIPFSEVVHLAVVLTESYWSRGRGFLVYPRNLASAGPGARLDRTPMSTKGFRYDLLMTQKGGRTIKVVTVRSSDAADHLVGQLRQRIGLPSVK